MNRERFELVLAAIERGKIGDLNAELRMYTWAERVAEEDGLITGLLRRVRAAFGSPSEPTCRTTLCLAGWASTLAGDPPDFRNGLPGRSVVTDHALSGRYMAEIAFEWLKMEESEIALFHALSCRSAADLRRRAELMAERGELTWTFTVLGDQPGETREVPEDDAALLRAAEDVVP